MSVNALAAIVAGHSDALGTARQQACFLASAPAGVASVFLRFDD
jgi:hypothetical protein